MLRVSELKKGFGSGSRRLEVLKGINMDVKAGELVSLMGPSGCGKSTLLNIIGGLLEADSGEITLDSFNYGTKSPNRVVDVRRSGVGWIFQDFHLVDRLDALDNVAFSLELSGMSSSEAEGRAMDALMRVGLADRMNFIPDQLSGGQQQRAAIARALAMQPEIILFDEPTSALDPELENEVVTVIKKLAQENRTMILVTHDMKLAKDISNYILFMDEGIIVEKGSPDVIFNNTKTDRLKKFLESVSFSNT